jgi:predicted transposase YbfD/YdcC
MPMTDFITIFREIRDPREANARHDLGSILFLALAATLCGAKTCVAIADFAVANEETLAEILDLPHGAPSHDTFSRVFRVLDPAELAGAFQRALGAMREALGIGPPGGVVAIDGKALRRAYDKGRAFMPAMMVSVWDAQTRLAIASKRAPDGGEIEATLQLLKTLRLKGAIVTADALHAHPRMASAIRNAKAHYALTLKANRSKLHADVARAFEKAGETLPTHETRTVAHGRNETRRAAVLPKSALEPAHDFPGLAAIGRIEATRARHGKPAEHAVRYVLLSKKLDPCALADTVRTHWSIENHLHWPLDVVFREDDARSRKDNAPENLAGIRRLAINILNAHPDNKSISRKMNLASWSKDYFFSLFAHMR